MTHVPVLKEEVVRILLTRPEGTYIDGTLGTGGHTEALLKGLGEGGRVLGIDRDREALEVARERLASFGPRCLFLHGSFEDLSLAGHLLGAREVDGILLDLGVSSLHLDDPRRGFSFQKEGMLDMRMDSSSDQTASELVRRTSKEGLITILKKFGEEPFAPRIAMAICEARQKGSIETTTELARIVAAAIPRRAWPRRIHPATRTFQALRIAVNDELNRLEIFLDRAPHFLKPGGRLVVISYHSLEDRLVKRSFLRWEKEGVLRRLGKKPIVAQEEEIRQNPRSRSAKLRAAEKIIQGGLA